ncbi:MAG TPA: hypothetical protein PLK37_13420 [Terricaulis sp.]|nr:hypothetical protein [Terricaulis sp.]
MAAIDLYGQAERTERVRENKKLHPSCYLLGGFLILVAAALLLDVMVGMLLA